MNSSSNLSNGSNDQFILEGTRAIVNLIAFIVTITCTCLIMQIVWQDSDLRKEIRYLLLCHHLVCIVMYFGLGFLFTGIRALKLDTPVLVCWILHAVQISFGRGTLLILTLMALNTYIAVCWPLRYLSFVHSIKRKAMAFVWFLALLNPVWSTIQESQNVPPGYIYKKDPSCPTSLDGFVPRIAGFVFILILVVVIVLSYCFIYREGKRSGHFNRSNNRARKTILIHILQISFHIVPVLISVGLGKNRGLVLRLMNSIIFSIAQSLSPMIYGLRCKEIRNKLSRMGSNGCLHGKLESSSGALSRQNTPLASVINDSQFNISDPSAS